MNIINKTGLTLGVLAFVGFAALSVLELKAQMAEGEARLIEVEQGLISRVVAEDLAKVAQGMEAYSFENDNQLNDRLSAVESRTEFVFMVLIDDFNILDLTNEDGAPKYYRIAPPAPAAPAIPAPAAPAQPAAPAALAPAAQ